MGLKCYKDFSSPFTSQSHLPVLRNAAMLASLREDRRSRRKGIFPPTSGRFVYDSVVQEPGLVPDSVEGQSKNTSTRRLDLYG